MRFTVNIFLIFLVFMCMVEMVQAQVVPHVVHDQYHEKKIDLDKLFIDEVFDIAVSFHRRDLFSSADTVYDYLIAKNLFTTNPEDTAQIGEYGTYINLAHLRIVKHKYKEAQAFLRLTDMAVQPEHFCGNAHQATQAEKKSYELVCQLALGYSPVIFSDLLNMLFQFPSLDYAGEGLVHYLTYKYGETGMLKIFDRAKQSITAEKMKEDDQTSIYAKGKILGGSFSFRIYNVEEMSDDPAVVKKMAMDYFKLSVDDWRNKY